MAKSSQYLLNCVALSALIASASVPAHADTLKEALSMAYASNPQLLEQRAFLRSVDQGVAQALSGWRPTITVQGDATLTHRNNYEIGGDPQDDTWRQGRSASIVLKQPVFTGLETVNDVDRAKNEVMAGREGLKSVEQTVLLDAVTAYLDVWRDMAVVELRTNNEQVLMRQLEAARDRFEVGEITRTDVAQSEARLSRARADKVSAEGDLQITRATYERVIGKMPDAVDKVPLLANLPDALPVLLEQALAANPDLRQADFSALADADNIGVVRSDLLPELNLVASAAKYWDRSTVSDESNEYEVGATLSIPLYEAGEVYAKVRKAKETAAQSRKALERVRRQVVETATSAWESLVSAQAQITAYQEEVRASEIALDGVRREAEVGSRTVLDVLDAEQELLDARVNLVRAERDVVLASYQVHSAMGQLTADYLELDGPRYDPTRNYDDHSGSWFGTGVYQDNGQEGMVEKTSAKTQ